MVEPGRVARPQPAKPPDGEAALFSWSEREKPKKTPADSRGVLLLCDSGAAGRGRPGYYRESSGAPAPVVRDGGWHRWLVLQGSDSKRAMVDEPTVPPRRRRHAHDLRVAGSMPSTP